MVAVPGTLLNLIFRNRRALTNEHVSRQIFHIYILKVAPWRWTIWLEFVLHRFPPFLVEFFYIKSVTFHFCAIVNFNPRRIIKSRLTDFFLFSLRLTILRVLFLFFEETRFDEEEKGKIIFLEIRFIQGGGNNRERNANISIRGREFLSGRRTVGK